jgi:hypothetical protein
MCRCKEEDVKVKKKKRWRTKRWGPSLVLAHAIRDRLHDALARVHGPIFALARIIPRREPLDRYHPHARTEMKSMSIHI